MIVVEDSKSFYAGLSDSGRDQEMVEDSFSLGVIYRV